MRLIGPLKRPNNTFKCLNEKIQEKRDRERERERDVSNGICKVVLRNLSFQNMEKVNLT